MEALRALCLALALTLCCAPVAWGEGFALNEWGARGVSLAGGMVGRADDASALAYNAAGITQLPGTHIMGGMAFIAPMGSIMADISNGQERSTTTKPAVWPVPHGYMTHQLNDDIWLGLGVFSRYGLGNSYDGKWVGRYNLYDVGVQTVSFVPTLAWKVNDMLSLSAGVEVMYAHMYLGTKIPTLTSAGLSDNDMQLEGYGWGLGAHFGLHMRFDDQWSMGLAYKSQVTLQLNGDVEFGRQGANGLIGMGQHLPPACDCTANTTIQLPDSLALGVAYKPLDNLSFEAGAMWTRWSTYNALNIYMDNGYNSISNKEWRDGLGFNASVEYKPLDWWALRAGVLYETPVLNENHGDFIMPTNGRTMLSVGTGFQWENWTLDLAYAHLWIYPVDYDKTDAAGIIGANGITGGHSKNVSADVYTFSVGYTF